MPRWPPAFFGIPDGTCQSGPRRLPLPVNVLGQKPDQLAQAKLCHALENDTVPPRPNFRVLADACAVAQRPSSGCKRKAKSRASGGGG